MERIEHILKMDSNKSSSTRKVNWHIRDRQDKGMKRKNNNLLEAAVKKSRNKLEEGSRGGIERGKWKGMVAERIHHLAVWEEEDGNVRGVKMKPEDAV